MSLKPEESQIIRRIIASLLQVDLEKVVPEAHFYRTLGGTFEHLKPLRLQIEAALNVDIETIQHQIDVLTEMKSNGWLLPKSLKAMGKYLGISLAGNRIGFNDLFTVAFIEAITAKACDQRDGTPQSTTTKPVSVAATKVRTPTLRISRSARSELERYLESEQNRTLMDHVRHKWNFDQRWSPEDRQRSLQRIERDRGNLTIEQCLIAARYNYVRGSIMGLAIAHRRLSNRLDDLLLGMSLSARIGWMQSGLIGSRIDDPLLEGLAVGDQLVAQRFTETLLPWDNEPGGFNIKCHGVVAVMRRDWSGLEHGLSLYDSHSTLPWYQAVKRLLMGLMNDDPQATSSALQEFFEVSKRQKIKGKHRNLLDYETHGLFRLAESLDPKFVADFDIQQGIPWDKEIHASVNQGHRRHRPWEQLDLRETSEELHVAVARLSRPVWWCE